MVVENADTHCLNLGQLLYNIEEKLNKKLVLNSSSVLFTHVYIDEGLLSNIRIYICIYIHVYI